MPLKTGAEIVINSLIAAGTKHLFSLSGNHILSLYDATIGREIEIIHTRHEAAAVHMADAWGRLTEQPGIALVAGGPGHANALSALYVALMAESPMVLLSGHAPLSQLGQGAFQEVNQVAMAKPVCKAAWLIEDVGNVEDDIAQAFALATSGRPGPVHLSLPTDVLEATVDQTSEVLKTSEVLPASDSLTETAIRQILTHLAAAKHPLILTGPALARPQRWADVALFSEVTGIPALPMRSPRGVNDPSLHLATSVLAKADIILLLGRKLDFSLRFGQPDAFQSECYFIQIDADQTPPQANERVNVSFQANPTAALQALTQATQPMAWTHKKWQDEVIQLRQTVPIAWQNLPQSRQVPIHPLRVCAAVQPYLDDGAMCISDGGEFGQWVQTGLEMQTGLINGPSGSIGSALPLGLGAKLAHPDRTVFACMGDGTFGFHALELDTALRYNIPIVVIIGNDARWNAEHQLQMKQYGPKRTIGCDLLPTRYDQLTIALGGHGELVEHPDDLKPALERALASGLPACINVMIASVGAPVI